MFTLPGARPRAPRPPITAEQKEEAIEAVWRSYWPFIGATIIGVFMLLFGLAVAGLEAASLELGGSIDTTTVSVTTSSRSNALRIGVGIWSGAIIAVAAIFIFIINCTSRVKHWAEASALLVGAAAIFSVVNFSINARVVRAGVVDGGFNSSNPTPYRLAAAQIPAASLSFLSCLAYLLMYLIVFAAFIRPITKRKEPIGIMT